MPRTGVVNVVFAVVFGLVAALAAATAAGTTDSWFSVEVSSLVFQTSIFAAIVTAFVLFGFAATHVARLEDARRSIDLRIATIPGVQGFAQTNFQLTTGIVLFLAYGLAFLVAWALAALASLVRRAPEPRNGDWPEPKPKLLRAR